jgi:transcription elongation factor GreA
MEINNQEYAITQEGLDALAQELKTLIEVERPAIIERIKEARSYGDLSENADYDAAKTEQGMVESRIAELESKVRNAVIIKKTNRKNVRSKIGSFVSFVNLSDESFEETYQLVGGDEADPLNAKVSSSSPLGSTLYDVKVGEICEFIIPSGEVRKIRITKVE